MSIMEQLKHTIITIEGTDGSGKKTQVKKLYEYLKAKKHEVMVVSFPNYESLSSGPVRMYLGGEFGAAADCLDAYQASVLYATDRLCSMRRLLASLETETVILFDRYAQSNMIHQAGKIGTSNEQAVDELVDWLENFEFSILKLPRADKVIFLDVPVEISMKNVQARGEQMEIDGCKDCEAAIADDIHERDKRHAVEAYLAGKYVAQKQGWEVINCVENGQLKSIDDIHELVKKVVKNLLKSSAK